MKYTLALFALTGALAAPSERRQQPNGGGSVIPSTIRLEGTNLCVHAHQFISEVVDSVNLQMCQVTVEDNDKNGAPNAPDQGWISTEQGTEQASYPGWCLGVTGNGQAAIAQCGVESDEIRSSDIVFNGQNLCMAGTRECFAVRQYDDTAGNLFLTDDTGIFANFVFPYLVK
ncbi:hypothetical protein A1Q2_05006 [Trichosporon asahii var. asahii CBS 8904]|uniref:Cyanovirin-N domain-containing protein n=2 Tax=Trichosporon asahii var. asahii TaxID=189963 RepID=K1WH66_TRIAC|nr:hypothetical protein A1Q1_00860 [Trichosporon asahii var. asahii CBS 2479]EJT50019.1 hypothetical protein A1Q1_00860 [Trichosporon asahii var. asahii CBS 2479]EKD00814.1 hypothetical protein A1Q2_05006 [Trichosporon asahii var. asahii CBS 8904]